MRNMNYSIRKRIPCPAVLLLLFSAVGALTQNVFALGETRYVQTESVQGSFPLFDQTAAPILIASNDWAGILRAGHDLATDVERVTGARPEINSSAPAATKFSVIIGTVGHSPMID